MYNYPFSENTVTPAVADICQSIEIK